MIALTVLRGSHKGQVLELPEGGSYRIGRRPSTSRPLPSPLKFEDRKMSRRHAEVCWIDGAWYLVDLRSTNGTFVNRKRIEGRIKIREGDLIQMGETLFAVGDPTPHLLGAEGSGKAAARATRAARPDKPGEAVAAMSEDEAGDVISAMVAGGDDDAPTDAGVGADAATGLAAGPGISLKDSLDLDPSELAPGDSSGSRSGMSETAAGMVVPLEAPEDDDDAPKVPGKPEARRREAEPGKLDAIDELDDLLVKETEPPVKPAKPAFPTPQPVAHDKSGNGRSGNGKTGMPLSAARPAPATPRPAGPREPARDADVTLPAAAAPSVKAVPAKAAPAPPPAQGESDTLDDLDLSGIDDAGDEGDKNMPAAEILGEPTAAASDAAASAGPAGAADADRPSKVASTKAEEEVGLSVWAAPVDDEPGAIDLSAPGHGEELAVAAKPPPASRSAPEAASDDADDDAGPVEIDLGTEGEEKNELAADPQAAPVEPLSEAESMADAIAESVIHEESVKKQSVASVTKAKPGGSRKWMTLVVAAAVLVAIAVGAVIAFRTAFPRPSPAELARDRRPAAGTPAGSATIAPKPTPQPVATPKDQATAPGESPAPSQSQPQDGATASDKPVVSEKPAPTEKPAEPAMPAATDKPADPVAAPMTPPAATPEVKGEAPAAAPVAAPAPSPASQEKPAAEPTGGTAPAAAPAPAPTPAPSPATSEAPTATPSTQPSSRVTRPAPAPAPLPVLAGAAFLLDASGSQIDGFPLLVARLAEDLAKLSETDRFTVIVFQAGQAIEPSPAGLKPATSAARRRVIEYLRADPSFVRPRGNADARAALAAAVGYHVRDVHFYSERPTAGAISGPEALVRHIDQLDPSRRTRVHAVHFFTADPRLTLKTLADRYRGTYQFIEDRHLPKGPIDPLDALMTAPADPANRRAGG